MAAIGKVAEATGTSAVKSAAKRVVKSDRFAKAKDVALNVAKRVPVGGVLYQFVQAANAAKIDPNKFAAAQKTEKAMNAIRADFKRRGQKLSRKDEYTLAKQHMEYFTKNP